MKKYDEYEDWVELIEENSPEIPKIITEEWLEEQLSDIRGHFKKWGFCFSNLSGHVFDDNIDYSIIRKIPFSTKTIFPEHHPFCFDESLFYAFDDVIKLQESGIDGSGIDVAIIDLPFCTVPYELKESLVKYVNYSDNPKVHFNGTSVAAKLCGKDLGVAPGCSLYFYGTGVGVINIVKDTLSALKDIYEQNKNGANIRIVSMSSLLHKEKSEYREICQKLSAQGCNIIDSEVFSKDFTCINKDANTGEFYYSDWQLRNKKPISNIAIPTGGKTIPLVTTEYDYLYCGQATESLGIPTLAGYFALALQVNPNLTYDEFVELARQTKQVKDGIEMFNIRGIIGKLNKKQKKYIKTL